MPIPVPATPVANVFPVVLAAAFAAIPLRGLGRMLAFPLASFVATGVYVLALTVVVPVPATPASATHTGP